MINSKITEIYQQIGKKTTHWLVQDTLFWLRLIQKGQYQESFETNSIDGTILLDLQEDDLIQLGITNPDDLQEFKNYISFDLQKITQLCQEEQDQQQFMLEEVKQNTQQISTSLDSKINKEDYSNEEIITTRQQIQPFLSVFWTEEGKRKGLAKLKQKTVTIGKDNLLNDIVISTGQQIDFQHGRVVYQEKDNNYYYEDNNSQFGTYFRVQGLKEVQVGSEIILGSFVLRIKDIYKIEKYAKIYADIEIKGIDSQQTLVKRVEISKDCPCSIGRSSESQIVLDDAEISKSHGLLCLGERNQLLISDISTRNRMWLKVKDKIAFHPESTFQLYLGRTRVEFIVGNELEKYTQRA